MKITVENVQGTGVTITEIQITEGQRIIKVSIHEGNSHTIELEDLDSCYIGVTYIDLNNPHLPTTIKRIAPVTGCSTISLVKTNGAMTPYLI